MARAEATPSALAPASNVSATTRRDVGIEVQSTPARRPLTAGPTDGGELALRDGTTAEVEDCARDGGAGLRVGGRPIVPDVAAGTVDRAGPARGELAPHAASDAITVTVRATLATTRVLTTGKSDSSRPAAWVGGPVLEQQ